MQMVYESHDEQGFSGSE